MLVRGKKSSAASSNCCKIWRAACSTVHTADVPALLAAHSLTQLIISLVSDDGAQLNSFVLTVTFQKQNTLETQAVCVNLTNTGCIFYNRCHANGLRHSIFHKVKNTDVRRYSTERKTNTDKSIESELGGLSYLTLYWCHVFFVTFFIGR